MEIIIKKYYIYVVVVFTKSPKCIILKIMSTYGFPVKRKNEAVVLKSCFTNKQAAAVDSTAAIFIEES